MYVLWKTKKLWQNGTYFSAHPRMWNPCWTVYLSAGSRFVTSAKNLSCKLNACTLYFIQWRKKQVKWTLKRLALWWLSGKSQRRAFTDVAVGTVSKVTKNSVSTELGELITGAKRVDMCPGTKYISRVVWWCTWVSRHRSSRSVRC